MVAPFLGRLSGAVPAQPTAATDEPSVIGRAPFAGTVSQVLFIPEANITGAATNNRIYSLINKGQDGNGTTVIATLEMASGVNATDFNELVIPLSGTPANLVVAAGDTLSWLSDAQNTGLADPGGTVIVEINRSTTPG